MIEDKQRNDKSLMTSFEAQKIVVNERSVEMIHITREKEGNIVIYFLIIILIVTLSSATVRAGERFIRT